MVMNFWDGRRVLVTGHTGFKGSWISLWLQVMGADLCGISLPPPSSPNLFELASVGRGMQSEFADIRDAAKLKSIIVDFRPEIVFHMAAQPLVRKSYEDPVGTYGTNVMGTVNLLEAVKSCPAVRAVVVITTDKCYENKEWFWPYREDDRLGGYDPYSNSKACAELVVSAYRNSFFHPAKFSEHGVAVASARAGNVIGGGDWASDRIVPDAMRAFSKGEVLRVRNPKAIRPWQHVLEPLRGYLVLAEHLISRGIEFGDAWNFGPAASDARTVESIIEDLASVWGGPAAWDLERGSHPHEARTLKLDCSKASALLCWEPVLPLSLGLRYTAEWYKQWGAGADARTLTVEQIESYRLLAKQD